MHQAPPHRTASTQATHSKLSRIANIFATNSLQPTLARIAYRCTSPARVLSSMLVALCCIGISSVSLAAIAPAASLAVNTTQQLGANIGQYPHIAATPMIIPQAPMLNAKAYVLMDANSGKIIAQKNMDHRLPPASLTKLMTLYIASNELRDGQIKLDDKALVSKKAWSRGGSRMFLKQGTRVSIKELIQGIIVDSGNDACVTLAQFIGGNEASFAQLMNQAAKLLGMHDSHFTDSTGLPHPDHYSTAHNLAILTRSLILNFPEDYTWYKQKWFTFGGIRQSNRNLLLWRDPTVDGLKTGHTKAAGYCLIASALRNNTRLISVVMGTPSTNARAESSQALLNYGYRFYRSKKQYHAYQPITNARVWFGSKRKVTLGPTHDIYTTLAINKTAPIQLLTHINPHLEAPITQGQVCGSADLVQNKQVIQSFQLISLESDAPTGSIGRVRDSFLLWVHKLWNKSNNA